MKRIKAINSSLNKVSNKCLQLEEKTQIPQNKIKEKYKRVNIKQVLII